MDDAIWIDYNTRKSVQQFNIAASATERFGFTFQDRVMTPKGAGTVIGVDREGHLYFHVDGDPGASFWGSCTSKEIFQKKGFRKITESTEKSTPSNQRDSTDYHNLKRVIINHQPATIVMQSGNGPCPVIALANALLLQGKLQSIAGQYDRSKMVSAQDLRDAVLRHIVQHRPRIPPVLEENPSEGTLNALIKNSAQMEEFFNQMKDKGDVMLKRYYDGLCVDPYFNRPDGFVAEQDPTLFPLAGVPLLHAWVMPPPPGAEEAKKDAADLPPPPPTATDTNNDDDNQPPPTAAAAQDDPLKEVRKMSYDELAVYATKDDDKISQAAAKDFLTRTQSQMTNHGLQMMLDMMKEGDVCVFYHNFHFSTVLKHNSQLFALSTDIAFAERKQIVFSSLSPDGSAYYFDGNFESINLYHMRVMEKYGNRWSTDQIDEATALCFSSGNEDPTVEDLVAMLTTL